MDHLNLSLFLINTQAHNTSAVPVTAVWTGLSVPFSYHSSACLGLMATGSLPGISEVRLFSLTSNRLRFSKIPQKVFKFTFATLRKAPIIPFEDSQN